MPLIVIGIIMEVMLRQIPNVYKFKKNYLDENSDKIEVLFLGNSHSYFGLNPDCMAKRSYNAAHVSQTFDYDLEIIRKYKDGWVNLKFIVLPISYFSLYDKMIESTESWRAKDYCIYYKIRISKYLPHYTEMLSGQLSLKFIRLWSFYVKRIDNIACTESGWGTSYKVRKPSLDLLAVGEYAAKRHRRLDDQYFNEMCSVLDSIIVFAEHKGFRIILFTPPAFESYRSNLFQDQLNRTVNAASDIAQSHSNCLYFNFLDDESFTETDFYDADHLNEAGARKLTLVIDSIINSEN
jgi:hypothetical protein